MGKDKVSIDFSSLSLVVYQNEPFIDGLYQSIHHGMTEEATSEDTKETGKKGRGEIEAGIKAPLIPAKAEAKVEGSVDRVSKQTYTQKMTYSNAYRLHQVKQEFNKHKELKKLKNKKSMDDIKLADFVEFQAKFEKNDFSELLDLVSPELGGVLGYMYYLDELKKGQEHAQTASLDPPQFSEQESNGRVALGRSIVESLHKEFRNELSSEFYGTICNAQGTGLGAKTILVCDKQFFTNGDSDRLLDGIFTIFGKVIDINKSGEGFSKFERNKFLKRIKPKGAEWLQENLKNMKDINEYINTDIELTIDGFVIKIIPVAIYA
jgi:hypothetical protein